MEFTENSYVPCPCKKDCEKRNSECHSTCEEYKLYADWQEWRRQQRANNVITYSYTAETQYKKKKRYHRGKV